MRMTRTMMLEVLRQDYIRTAWSKGLRERVVVIRHTIKNAFIPVVTLIGLQFAHPGWWLRYHGEHLQPAGVRSSTAVCTRWQRLPVGLRSKPGFRRRGCGVQSNDRPDLSLFGPEGAV